MLKSVLLSLNLLVTNTSFADIMPTQEERLAHPVALDCGVTIIENVELKNGKPTKQELSDADIKVLNVVCSKAIRRFQKFISHNHMGSINSEAGKFTWTASFIPRTRQHRCLNDRQDRFSGVVFDSGTSATDKHFVSSNVAVHNLIDGFTSINNRHSFSMSLHSSNTGYSPQFVFAHELFHALTIFYNNPTAAVQLLDTETEDLADGFARYVMR